MSTSVSNIAARDEEILEAAKRACFAFYGFNHPEKDLLDILWDDGLLAKDRARWIRAAAAVLDMRT